MTIDESPLLPQNPPSHINRGGGTLAITNSTFSGNDGGYGSAIVSGRLAIINVTFSGNRAYWFGGAISGSGTIQNSIVANNQNGGGYPNAGNCDGLWTSNGYNLSSDNTCGFNSVGDMNNIDPQLGPLQNNGGPTQTMAIPPGSPAVNAGNPNGCTNDQGQLLKTDQRGMPRPDKESGRCDMGAYELQSD